MAGNYLLPVAGNNLSRYSLLAYLQLLKTGHSSDKIQKSEVQSEENNNHLEKIPFRKVQLLTSKCEM
jgi:hypothetical protein